MQIPFRASEQSTLGVEWELAILDAESLELAPKAPTILDYAAEHLPALPGQPARVTGEMLQNTVELVTGVCHTVAEAQADLAQSLAVVQSGADANQLALMCAGTHPFSLSRMQAVTDKERYAKLVDRTQWWGAQMVIFGVHVHVGLDSVAKALPVVDGLINYFPHIQALSASSPFWNGEDTGYASQRALMFQQLPTAGLPFHFDRWAEYEHYVADMLTTGVIDDMSEIRWDVRPVPNLGTVEMRICDGLSTLEEIGAIAALTQCLVQHFSDILDDGGTIPTMPPWHVQENKWRAARYGLDAIIIQDAASNERLVTDDLYDLLNTLEPVARKLQCNDQLAHVEDIIRRGAGYQRQRRVAAAHHGDLKAVVKELTSELRWGFPATPGSV